MIAQLHKFTKNHWILYLQWVNFMVCKLYLNKAGKKTQQRAGGREVGYRTDNWWRWAVGAGCTTCYANESLLIVIYFWICFKFLIIKNKKFKFHTYLWEIKQRLWKGLRFEPRGQTPGIILLTLTASWWAVLNPFENKVEYDQIWNISIKKRAQE